MTLVPIHQGICHKDFAEVQLSWLTRAGNHALELSCAMPTLLSHMVLLGPTRFGTLMQLRRESHVEQIEQGQILRPALLCHLCQFIHVSSQAVGSQLCSVSKWAQVSTIHICIRAEFASPFYGCIGAQRITILPAQAWNKNILEPWQPG